MRQALDEKAVTFFALLGEGNKLDVYNRRFMLVASAYPHMSDDDRESVKHDLELPDDTLETILEDEHYDSVSKLKGILEGK